MEQIEHIIYYYVLKIPDKHGIDEYHLRGFDDLEKAKRFKEKADNFFKDRMVGSKIIKRKPASFYNGWLF